MSEGVISLISAKNPCTRRYGGWEVDKIFLETVEKESFSMK
mgnify:CR=1 FL=1